VLTAPLADHSVAYDLVTEVVHVLNPTAALVWELCDGETLEERLIEELADITGADADDVAADVHAYVETLAEAGLVHRDVPPPAAEPIARRPGAGAHATAVFGVLDDGVVLRSDDAELVEQVDVLLASMAVARPVTLTLGLQGDAEGGVSITGWGDDRRYHSAKALLDGLPTALNLVAAATTSCIALHAACVRAPGGDVVVLPAPSGGGKTTLAGALVRLGWDYATDEAVGIRPDSLVAVAYPKPLVLDASSREVLRLPPTIAANTLPTELRADVVVAHGDVGPIDRVVLPRYEPGARLHLELLEPPRAVVAVLEHALNLRRVGQPGLETLCDLAQQVPVLRLVHGDINEAVGAVTDSSTRA
jgi:hypothetical protein